MQETFDKSGTVEVETSQEVTNKLTRSSLVDNSYSVNSSVSSSLLEKYHNADGTTPDHSTHSGDDISTPNTTTLPRWAHNKGHKRSKSSNIMDYSTNVVVGHRRSNSFDVNLLAYKNNTLTTVNAVDSDFPSPVVKDGEQEEEQVEEQKQATPSDLLHDDVDFTGMFGIWKGS